MSKTLITSATPGQIKQINRFGSDAIEKVLAGFGLDNPGAQCVIERGDDFAEAIRMAAITSLMDLSVSNQFSDEEVNSSYVYPRGYKVKGIAEQTNILRQFFPGIGFANEKLAEQPLPSNLPTGQVGAEGWFAIPRWEKIALTYGEAVEKVLAMIGSKRKFCNYCDGQLGAEHLRQHAKTAKMFQELGDEQKDFDILIVPCQFGLRHRGRSVRRAREVFMTNEFGLGAFAIGIMLLTHPEREVRWEQLHVDCAGDEFSSDADGFFGHAPFFDFSGDMLGFDACQVDCALEDYGSVSAFRQ